MNRVPMFHSLLFSYIYNCCTRSLFLYLCIKYPFIYVKTSISSRTITRLGHKTIICFNIKIVNLGEIKFKHKYFCNLCFSTLLPLLPNADRRRITHNRWWYSVDISFFSFFLLFLLSIYLIFIFLLLGMCHKCNEKVLGEGSGCTAMEKVYHIQCFTCHICRKFFQFIFSWETN